MKLTDRCQHEFQWRDRDLGRRHFENRLVQFEQSGDHRLRVSVAGSYDQASRVAIDWGEVADLDALAVHCSCARFSYQCNCEHIWATLLQMELVGLSDCVPGLGKLSVDGAVGLVADVFDAAASKITESSELAIAARSQTKKKRRRAGRIKKTQNPQWQKAFEVLNQQANFEGDCWNDNLTEVLAAKRREVWYVLSVGQSVANELFIIEFLQRETKKNGEFGSFKRLKLRQPDIDSFSNQDDRELLSELLNFSHVQDYNSSYRYSRYGYEERLTAASIPASLYGHFLPRLEATGRFVWTLDGGQPFEDARPLAWRADTPWRFELSVRAVDEEKHWVLDGHISRNGQTRHLREAVLATPAGLLLIDDTLHRLEIDPAAYNWLHTVSASSPIVVPYKDREKFLRQLWSTPALPKIELPENLRWEQLHEPPRPKLKVYAPGDTPHHSRSDLLSADISFLYGTQEVRANDPHCGIPMEPVPGIEESDVTQLSPKTDAAVENSSGGSVRELVYLRDRNAETSRLAELGGLGVTKAESYYSSKGDVQFSQRQLMTLVEKLSAKGWQVEAEGMLFRTAGEFKIDVRSGIDWFELDAAFDFEGVEVKLPELLAAVRKGDNFVVLGDGSRGILPEKWLARYTHLTDLGTVEGGKVRFKPSQALLLDAMLDEQENLRVDQKFRRFRQQLRAFDGVKAKHEPKSFCGTLRDYQRDGLGWFHFLRELGIGGCLADDMGLGKTIQVLALLENRRLRRLKKDETRWPSLVVAPKSVIFNWIDEAKRFTPKLRVADYSGLDRKQRVGDLNKYHLVVTTYGTMRRDIAALKGQRFDYAILDESQAIKNGASQSAKASRLLSANHYLSLTGTPIENHLGELWSLFEFLNPGMLGRTGAFASLCKSAKPGEDGSLADLSRAVAPFILRRTKDQVLKELPPKTEQMIHCDLLPKQRKQYNELREYYRAKLTKKIDERGLKQSKIHVLEALLRLRQAACHPGLVDQARVNEPSAKIEVLLKQIREILAEGHKALIFSQFTSLLAIVRSTLEKESICYEYLDGGTVNRKEKVQRFQTDADCPLFLISLKAGGSGLNLTAADYVFILDPWWNPAVEAQAIDRTHRIGQTRPVFAYRIIASDTVEEKVLELQESKRSLASAIISADDSLIRNLTADDLKVIFS